MAISAAGKRPRLHRFTLASSAVSITSLLFLRLKPRPSSKLVSDFSLCLRQPVRHRHLAIHRRRSGQMLLRLLALARAPVELSQPSVAVGDEGPAELARGGRRLAVVTFSIPRSRYRAQRGHLMSRPERASVSVSYARPRREPGARASAPCPAPTSAMDRGGGRSAWAPCSRR